MNCVNRNSKEFKFLAEHNDLSINALELITHKYWLENKTEDYFPSDAYIQAQLGKIPYEEPTKVVRELWDLKYKDPQEFASLEGLEEARKEALRYFPEEAVTYHTNFKGNYVLTIRKPIAKLSIDISDLTGKTTHDGQEQADFNLLVNSLGLNTIQNNIKELQLSISSPQTFTFKDGTTVKAPFKPNYQQEDALNAMDEFINSNRTSMTLSGYAGTGKTSLMEMLAEKMRKQYKPVMFCASTNKAAAVLKERVSKSGFEAQTLNKVFGITVEVDPNKSYNAKNLVNKLKDVDIPYGTTVIIDEASMINEENYNILNNIAKNNGLKIIYVGDAAQLAPVNETKISKVFRDQNHEVRTLSIVERTGDNAILKEATDLRNGKALSGESSFNSKGQGVAYLKPSSTQEREAIIKRFIPELKSNPNYFRILAYTNAAVAAYNTQVRQLLGYNDNIPRVGEPITGYANWGYNWKTKSYKFINSEAYKVVEVNSPKKAHISLSDGSTVTMQAVPITLENSLGERDTFNLMDIKGNLENRRIATQLANMKSQLWNKARGLSGKAKAPILQQINAIDEFLFVNDNITEGERTLQTKVFDFGYAMTVHKSQGSTFTHVLMDDVDINKAKDERNTDIGMEDIAIGWEDAANEEPTNYEVAGPREDIDMGDWEDETPSTEGTLIQEAPKTENSNAANIRQQLKYVAVSRATDTVTIISDNVKKEDTPLNHINEAPASQEATQQKPVEQMSSTEVWRYLSAMQPLTKRSQVEYTPKGQARQTYTVENGHIYNSKGTEVYPGKTVHKNMILANYAVKEGLAVVVEHPTSGEKYVVDNNQQITSVHTGNIMKWGEENGDRRRILAQAEKEFRERITAAKERGSVLNDQLLDYLQLMGIDVHNENKMAQYLKERGNKAIQQAMQTPEGEIRGFATPEGSLYFDRTVMSPEHPVHEYTHLWDRVVAKNNPELWNRGITLMKQISLWKDIENDANYGRKWKALKGMTPKKLESLIASEVHSRLVGVNGEQILDRLSKEKGQKGIIGRLKQWLLDFWKDLKATFSNWSKEDLDKLTLQDFTMMTVRDFADGFNPNTFQQAPTEKTSASKASSLDQNTINPQNQRYNNKPINYGNDFRRIQETVRRDSQRSSVLRRDIGEDSRRRLARITKLELDSNTSPQRNSQWTGVSNKGVHYNIIGEIPAQLFHDIFEVVRYYTVNGELVDLHDDYSDCKCYLSDDGTCGFAIEPDGNLVSVFNLGLNRGFLSAIKDIAIAQGANHLDAFDSNVQPLRKIYEHTLGAKVASSMDYNMEYDHDNIAANHGNPQVVFMVMGKAAEGKIEEKHFNKDQYDEAQAYQQSFLPTQQQPAEEPLDTSAIFQNPSSTEVTVEDKMKPWRSDPSKQNISRRIYLKGHKDKGYFEVVKDFEDGYYSVHFKPTDSDNPNAFSKEEKEILFQAVADTIPVDGKLSTWGELSRGGIAGLERFSKLGFAKSGERTVAMKGTGEEVTIPVFTKYPDTTTRISLKGYEYFTDAYEDTLVDAPWKIPFLQELDRQFSTENPEGKNEEIVNQMKAILEAKSYEEWQNNTDSKTKEQVQKNLDEYDKLITQLNNLLDSDVITASEVRHVAELVVNAISDNITQLQKEKGLAEQQFPTLNSKLDFQTASRKDIINTIGINRLIHRAKLLFDPEANDYEDLDTIEQADLIIDNWDAIMTLASDIFAANEGVGISRDFDNGGWHSLEGQKIDYDNFNDYGNDPDAMAEETKDEQEHWQIEQRTIDILNSMSAMVRLALHECYQVDKEGNIIKSKWGIPERVNARNAVNSILRWTQGSLSLEDMITKLSAKQAQQPWLGQLIERLNDKSGNETDFQSQFYGVFAKHFQLYSVVLLEDGKYHSMIVNSHPALSEAMQTITTQFKVGEHPLFTSRGINKTLLGSNDTTNPKATFNLHKALAEMRILCDRINHGEDVNAEIAEIATNNIMGVCRVLGYPVTESMVSEIINNDNILYLTEKLGFIVNSLDKAAEANKKDYDPFAYKKENSIGGSLRNFLTPITDQLEDTATNAFYDSGKMYQSYVTPSFMTKLLQKFRLEGQAFEDFLDSEYGNSEWFKFKGRNGAWRNEWLRMLATNEEARKVFDHKVELNFNKHNYMRNMSDAEYTLSLFAEYFAEGTDDKQSMVPAWFRIPMQSNKPSSEFIKFYSYRGANYKNDITDGMYNMFLQELSRIQTVRMRNLPKNHPSFIKNFDKNGKMFNFLPFLNSYLEDTAAAKRGRNLLDTTDSVDENTDFAKILQKKLRGDELSSDEEANLMKYAKKAIYNHMGRRAQEILDRWEQESILEAAKQVEGVGKEDVDVRNSIENYLWNDAFAAKNILQLTVGDIAFYKDAEDLQKRLAQLHAPGIRGNVTATDYQGNRVSDGYYRTFILQDFDTFRSNIIANITEVFDRKIARAPKSQKVQLEALKDSLVRPPKTNGSDDKGGKYWNINVTDAQGYSSPSSYRKKAFIFGKWSHKAEDIYQKLLSGKYNYTDLEVAFQPLKPFVYTHLEKHIGDGTPIETMNVPFQAKNSEYLLIMADAIMQSEVKESGELSRPNLLRAVYRVMENSERLNPTKGIDTVQFESAIKSGLQGKINIHQFAEMADGEQRAYDHMMSQIYQNYDPATVQDGSAILSYNTDTFVHEASYEDYCLQQEVPEHFKEHSQAHGSQIRMITPSDLDMYKDPNGDINDENNINYYEWTEPDGTKRKVKADEFKKEYEQTIADNIAESIENLSKELHLNSLDKKERNIALSKILLREILSSPRYGVDLAQACAVDKNTGEFRIPKGDPIQAKRIEQLINSIIKNRVNKQKIAGGPIVQVTNFGTSKQLHIRFKDNSGKILLTEEEFNNKLKGEAVRIIYKDYKEYLQKEQHGIAYFEVFIPIWANEIFEKFANEDGTIDVKAIEAVDLDLLKMISYRIPTEDKYSCAPMKVVGFMPREAGDAIMLPYELTEIDDSDFDVDKRYVMRKDIQIVENKKAIEKLLIQKVSESYAKAYDGKVNKRFIVEQVKMYMDNPDRMKTADKLMEYIHSQKQLIMKQYKDKVYKTIKPTTGKKYRDNKIIDMTWAVLTNEMTADKILNPGGFDNFKRVGYMAAAYRLKSHEMSWSQLEEKTTDELNDLCYVDKDLTWADTQIQFYKQNAAAASLIGVFAVNKVAHATLEGDNVFLDISEVINSEEPFTIGGTVFGGKRDTNGNPLMTKEEYDEWITTLPGFKKKDMSYEEYLLLNEDTSQRNRMQVDPKYDREGNLIGKTLGSGVSASADAAKTPVLNLLNINMTTVGTFTSLLRLRMPHEEACMFIGQDIIARILDDFNRQNLTGYASLNSVITKEINRLRKKHSITEDSAIDKEPLTKEELIRGLTPDEHEVIDYKVLIAFQKAKAIADSIRKLSFPTRFNSISSAVGPLIIDNLILEHKMEQFMDKNADTHFYTAGGQNVDITDVFTDHPILNQFSRTVDIARQMTSDMPAGSTGFRNLLNKIPDDIKEKLYNDKKLFSTLSDFYQSYLAIASGLINPANLKSYIDGFHKWFMKENFKEKYPDNALIQAIQMTVSKRTGRAFLTIKLTGEDETVKESYRNAWIDLHKTNPELSQQLFEYCFFRAGIGFSPKTFMAVVPTYVKERLQRQLPNGEKATYLDTYRKFPSIPEEVLFDQFIANNWEDNKLVPRKGGKNSHFIIKGTELYATTPEDIADLEGLSYIKTSGKGKTYLWKKVSGDENEVHYTQMKPLGNNGEYLEISLNRINNPMTATTQTSENNDASEIKTTSTSETDATEEKQEPLTTENKRAKAIAALAKDFMEYNETSFGRKIKESRANAQAEDMVNNPERYGSLMQNMLKSKGIEMSKEEAIKKLKELNLC